jgi:transposase InsO family protein
MMHVCLDLFRMDAVNFNGEIFDTMAVCVDRHSGWIVAVPCQNKGLTGRKVALAMFKEWRILGIPSILTSDQGSHFTSEWWKPMCAELGIRHAYTQAYHHQANGRAEVTGQQIKEILRKVVTDTKRTWIEVLPQVLDRLHDVKGQ